MEQVCAYTIPDTEHVINTNPAPCQHLFGLFKHCTRESFSFIFEHLADKYKHSTKGDCVTAFADGCRGEMRHTHTHTLWRCGHSSLLFISFPPPEQVSFCHFKNSSLSTLPPVLPSSPADQTRNTLFHASPVQSSRAVIQSSPHPQPYVVLRLGPPGLLTDFWRELVRWKAWSGPCPGIWPCPPTVVG